MFNKQHKHGDDQRKGPSDPFGGDLWSSGPSDRPAAEPEAAPSEDHAMANPLDGQPTGDTPATESRDTGSARQKSSISDRLNRVTRYAESSTAEPGAAESPAAESPKDESGATGSLDAGLPSETPAEKPVELAAPDSTAIASRQQPAAPEPAPTVQPEIKSEAQPEDEPEPEISLPPIFAEPVVKSEPPRVDPVEPPATESADQPLAPAPSEPAPARSPLWESEPAEPRTAQDHAEPEPEPIIEPVAASPDRAAAAAEPEEQPTHEQPTHEPAPRPAAQPAMAAEEQVLTVGRGIRLVAKTCECDALVVEGHLEATAQSRHLTVAQGGSFIGNAEVDVAEISGNFEGSLTAAKQLVITANGCISGTVRYEEITIEPGGKILGNTQCLTVAPQGPSTGR